MDAPTKDSTDQRKEHTLEDLSSQGATSRPEAIYGQRFSIEMSVLK